MLRGCWINPSNKKHGAGCSGLPDGVPPQPEQPGFKFWAVWEDLRVVCLSEGKGLKVYREFRHIYQQQVMQLAQFSSMVFVVRVILHPLPCKTKEKMAFFSSPWVFLLLVWHPLTDLLLLRAVPEPLGVLAAGRVSDRRAVPRPWGPPGLLARQEGCADPTGLGELGGRSGLAEWHAPPAQTLFFKNPVLCSEVSQTWKADVEEMISQSSYCKASYRHCAAVFQEYGHISSSGALRCGQDFCY